MESDKKLDSRALDYESLKDVITRMKLKSKTGAKIFDTEVLRLERHLANYSPALISLTELNRDCYIVLASAAKSYNIYKDSVRSQAVKRFADVNEVVEAILTHPTLESYETALKLVSSIVKATQELLQDQPFHLVEVGRKLEDKLVACEIEVLVQITNL